MDIKDFLDKFSSCLNHPPATPISPDTEFKKLEDWSSIFALIVIAMVDADYHKVLDAEDLKNSRTLIDLFQVIQSK